MDRGSTNRNHDNSNNDAPLDLIVSWEGPIGPITRNVPKRAAKTFLENIADIDNSRLPITWFWERIFDSSLGLTSFIDALVGDSELPVSIHLNEQIETIRLLYTQQQAIESILPEALLYFLKPELVSELELQLEAAQKEKQDAKTAMSQQQKKNARDPNFETANTVLSQHDEDESRQLLKLPGRVENLITEEALTRSRSYCEDRTIEEERFNASARKFQDYTDLQIAVNKQTSWISTLSPEKQTLLRKVANNVIHRFPQAAAGLEVSTTLETLHQFMFFLMMDVIAILRYLMSQPHVRALPETHNALIAQIKGDTIKMQSEFSYRNNDDHDTDINTFLPPVGELTDITALQNTGDLLTFFKDLSKGDRTVITKKQTSSSAINLTAVLIPQGLQFGMAAQQENNSFFAAVAAASSVNIEALKQNINDNASQDQRQSLLETIAHLSIENHEGATNHIFALADALQQPIYIFEPDGSWSVALKNINNGSEPLFIYHRSGEDYSFLSLDSSKKAQEIVADLQQLSSLWQLSSLQQLSSAPSSRPSSMRKKVVVNRFQYNEVGDNFSDDESVGTAEEHEDNDTERTPLVTTSSAPNPAPTPVVSTHQNASLFPLPAAFGKSLMRHLGDALEADVNAIRKKGQKNPQRTNEKCQKMKIAAEWLRAETSAPLTSLEAMYAIRINHDKTLQQVLEIQRDQPDLVDSTKDQGTKPSTFSRTLYQAGWAFVKENPFSLFRRYAFLLHSQNVISGFTENKHQEIAKKHLASVTFAIKQLGEPIKKWYKAKGKLSDSDILNSINGYYNVIKGVRYIGLVRLAKSIPSVATQVRFLTLMLLSGLSDGAFNKKLSSETKAWLLNHPQNLPAHQTMTRSEFIKAATTNLSANKEVQQHGVGALAAAVLEVNDFQQAEYPENAHLFVQQYNYKDHESKHKLFASKVSSFLTNHFDSNAQAESASQPTPVASILIAKPGDTVIHNSPDETSAKEYHIRLRPINNLSTVLQVTIAWVAMGMDPIVAETLALAYIDGVYQNATQLDVVSLVAAAEILLKRELECATAEKVSFYLHLYYTITALHVSDAQLQERINQFKENFKTTCENSKNADVKKLHDTIMNDIRDPRDPDYLKKYADANVVRDDANKLKSKCDELISEDDLQSREKLLRIALFGFMNPAFHANKVEFAKYVIWAFAILNIVKDAGRADLHYLQEAMTLIANQPHYFVADPIWQEHLVRLQPLMNHLRGQNEDDRVVAAYEALQQKMNEQRIVQTTFANKQALTGQHDVTTLMGLKISRGVAQHAVDAHQLAVAIAMNKNGARDELMQQHTRIKNHDVSVFDDFIVRIANTCFPIELRPRYYVKNADGSQGVKLTDHEDVPRSQLVQRCRDKITHLLETNALNKDTLISAMRELRRGVLQGSPESHLESLQAKPHDLPDLKDADLSYYQGDLFLDTFIKGIKKIAGKIAVPTTTVAPPQNTEHATEPAVNTLPDVDEAADQRHVEHMVLSTVEILKTAHPTPDSFAEAGIHVQGITQEIIDDYRRRILFPGEEEKFELRIKLIQKGEVNLCVEHVLCDDDNEKIATVYNLDVSRGNNLTELHRFVQKLQSKIGEQRKPHLLSYQACLDKFLWAAAEHEVDKPNMVNNSIGITSLITTLKHLGCDWDKLIELGSERCAELNAEGEKPSPLLLKTLAHLAKNLDLFSVSGFIFRKFDKNERITEDIRPVIKHHLTRLNEIARNGTSADHSDAYFHIYTLLQTILRISDSPTQTGQNVPQDVKDKMTLVINQAQKLLATLQGKLQTSSAFFEWHRRMLTLSQELPSFFDALIDDMPHPDSLHAASLRKESKQNDAGVLAELLFADPLHYWMRGYSNGTKNVNEQSAYEISFAYALQCVLRNDSLHDFELKNAHNGEMQPVTILQQQVLIFMVVGYYCSGNVYAPSINALREVAASQLAGSFATPKLRQEAINEKVTELVSQLFAKACDSFNQLMDKAWQDKYLMTVVNKAQRIRMTQWLESAATQYPAMLKVYFEQTAAIVHIQSFEHVDFLLKLIDDYRKSDRRTSEIDAVEKQVLTKIFDCIYLAIEKERRSSMFTNFSVLLNTQLFERVARHNLWQDYYNYIGDNLNQQGAHCATFADHFTNSNGVREQRGHHADQLLVHLEKHSAINNVKVKSYIIASWTSVMDGGKRTVLAGVDRNGLKDDNPTDTLLDKIYIFKSKYGVKKFQNLPEVVQQVLKAFAEENHLLELLESSSVPVSITAPGVGGMHEQPRGENHSVVNPLQHNIT